MLKIRGHCGIEINAACVGNPGERRGETGSQPNRTDESILQRQRPILRIDRDIQRFFAPPQDRGARGNALGRIFKNHTAALKKTPHMPPLSGGNADRMQRFRETTAHPPLQAHPLDQPLDLAPLQGLGIDISGVIDQRRVDKLLEGGRSTARRGGQLVVCETPPRIERHAENPDRFSPEQAFKTHLRSHGINRAALFQKPRWMPVIPKHADRGIFLERLEIEMASFSTAHHLRMHLEENRGSWILEHRRIQHSLKSPCIRLPEGDRGVATGLIHHQHKIRRQILQTLAGMIVFGYPFATPESSQVTGSLGLLRIQGTPYEALEP